MRGAPTVLFFSAARSAVPPLVTEWAAEQGFALAEFSDPAVLEALILRGHPSVLFVDGDSDGSGTLALVDRLKRDPFTAIVPVTVLLASEQVTPWIAAGADEVVGGRMSAAEQAARVRATYQRAERDLSVHPSTRLPGAPEIERELQRRLNGTEPFAMCYADLDHFKEFNDRYSYYDGDRVIFLLSRILHDAVKGLLGERGFVGHIGGDDFVFVIPADEIARVCGEVLQVFDTLIPLQYNEQDRRAGYFFGKDRRGQLHRVPMMTLSIGVVTNRNRRFTHPAQISELATEMKSYAKTLPGSVFVVDRRRSVDAEDAATPTPAAAPGKGDGR